MDVAPRNLLTGFRRPRPAVADPTATALSPRPPGLCEHLPVHLLALQGQHRSHAYSEPSILSRTLHEYSRVTDYDLPQALPDLYFNDQCRMFGTHWRTLSARVLLSWQLFTCAHQAQLVVTTLRREGFLLGEAPQPDRREALRESVLRLRRHNIALPPEHVRRLLQLLRLHARETRRQCLFSAFARQTQRNVAALQQQLKRLDCANSGKQPVTAAACVQQAYLQAQLQKQQAQLNWAAEFAAQAPSARSVNDAFYGREQMTDELLPCYSPDVRPMERSLLQGSERPPSFAQATQATLASRRSSGAGPHGLRLPQRPGYALRFA